MPVSDRAAYHGYYYASPECWSVYTEVLGSEFSSASLFGQVHQLTVDAYAAQHAGGAHPDKSVGIHLCGLHLVLDRGIAPTAVPRSLQRLAGAVRQWPHFPAPAHKLSLTVFDVALCASAEEHIKTVRQWADLVWKAWWQYHAAVADLVTHHFTHS